MRADRAIILAAGRGSRMKAVTRNLPKGLIELDGKSLVEWQIAALRKAGIEDIVIVTGYRMEQFRHFGTRIAFNPEWETTNMVHTLFCVEDEADRPVIISYSDVIYDSEYVRFLAKDSRDTVICYDLDWHDLWSRRFDDPLSDAESFRVNTDGSIQDIGRSTQTLSDIQGQYMGLLRFTPATIRAIRTITDEAQRRKMDMTGLLRLLIEAGHPVYGLPVQGRWCEIDDETDLSVARSLVAEERIPRPF